MNPRTLTLMMALLLGGCTSISYEAGREVSDVPAGIDTIRLDEVAPVGVLFVGKAEENIDTTPSENDVEVLAAVRAALVKDFAAAGIAVVEGNDRPAPVSMRVYVSYQPERWPLVLRNVTVYLHLFDQDGGSSSGRTMAAARSPSRSRWCRRATSSWAGPWRSWSRTRSPSCARA
jgi:hypothetical protein